MPASSPPLKGGCLCGRVQFQLNQTPLISLACHCRGCQKLTSSAFSLNVMVPLLAFELTKGSTVVGALHKKDARYGFCDWCKCWITTAPPPESGIINVRSTLLEDALACKPFVEMWTKEKLPWASTPAKHSFDEQPSADAFPALIEEYSRR